MIMVVGNDHKDGKMIMVVGNVVNVIYELLDDDEDGR